MKFFKRIKKISKPHDFLVFCEALNLQVVQSRKLKGSYRRSCSALRLQRGSTAGSLFCVAGYPQVTAPPRQGAAGPRGPKACLVRLVQHFAAA